MALLYGEETRESSITLSPVEAELAGSTFLTQKLKFRDCLLRALDTSLDEVYLALQCLESNPQF